MMPAGRRPGASLLARLDVVLHGVGGVMLGVGAVAESARGVGGGEIGRARFVGKRRLAVIAGRVFMVFGGFAMIEADVLAFVAVRLSLERRIDEA